MAKSTPRSAKTARRPYEYDHHYGLGGGTRKAVDGVLLRLSGSVRRQRDIDIWLNAQVAELGGIAREWFEVMRECGDDVRELIHDGCPVVCIEDVPFAYVNVFTAHVNVGFFLGAALPDPRGLLEGTGKRMRHVKLRPGREPNSAALNALIDAAYFDVNARLKTERRTDS